MNNVLRKKLQAFTFVFVCLLLGEVLRYFNVRNRWFVPLGVARSMIYIGLITAWGISIRWRIVQRQVRQYLSGIAGLLLFWFCVRTVKYFFVTDIFWIRQLWYMYYIPITGIPLLAFYIAVCIGQIEDFSVGKREKLLYIPAVLLVGLILTNDWHQWAFRFPAGQEWSDGNGIHTVIYFADAIWVFTLAIAALCLMFKKCRVPQNRKRIWQPFIPLGLAVVYTILYVSGFSWLRLIAGDMIVVYSVLIIAIFEMCIQCRLIQSNTGYIGLFQSCAIPVWLVDEKKTVLLASGKGRALENMSGDNLDIFAHWKKKEEDKDIIDNHWLIQRKPLTSMENGNIVWAEDISEMLDLIEKLRIIQNNLIDENALAEKEYKIVKRKARVEEQKRLYLQMQEETKAQSKELEALLYSYEKLECEKEKENVLKKAALLETYLQRRNTLFLNTAKTPYVPMKEIAFTFRDTQKVLESYDIGFAVQCFAEGKFKGDSIKKMYDFLEQVIEYSVDSMTALFVSVTKKEEIFIFTILTDCKKDCFVFSSENITVEQDEDGEWKLVYFVS